MTYPNLRRKQYEQSLFKPEDYILKYRKLRPKDFPSSYVFLWNRDTFNYFKRVFTKKYVPVKLYSHHQVMKMGKIGVVLMTGIGAPHSVTILEELIALGGKKFICIGTAGGLHRRGIYLCTKAIRDEGVSSHYLKHTKYAHPNHALSLAFGKSLSKRGVSFEQKPSWTIDTPYRETIAEVQKYHKEGVGTVEMEAAALFVVGQVRTVQVASGFVVSDVLDKNWEPEFHAINVTQGLRTLLHAAIDCFSE